MIYQEKKHSRLFIPGSQENGFINLVSRRIFCRNYNNSRPVVLGKLANLAAE